MDRMAKLVWAMRLGAYILAGYAVAQATAIILGGSSRFSAPGYYVAMQVPGAPPIWGWFLLPLAIAGLFGIRANRHKLVRDAMFGMGVWSSFFCLAFLLSAIRDPQANFTAVFAYGKDTLMFVLVAVAYNIRRKDPGISHEEVVRKLSPPTAD